MPAQDCELCRSIKLQVLFKMKTRSASCSLAQLQCGFLVSIKWLEKLNFSSVIVQQVYLSFYFMKTFKK